MREKRHVGLILPNSSLDYTCEGALDWPSLRKRLGIPEDVECIQSVLTGHVDGWPAEFDGVLLKLQCERFPDAREFPYGLPLVTAYQLRAHVEPEDEE